MSVDFDLWPPEPPPVSGEQAEEMYRVLRERLDREAGEGYASCIYGEKVLHFNADRAYGPGHIYSDAGRQEFRISGCCEYHFDKMFQEEG